MSGRKRKFPRNYCVPHCSTSDEDADLSETHEQRDNQRHVAHNEAVEGTHTAATFDHDGAHEDHGVNAERRRTNDQNDESESFPESFPEADQFMEMDLDDLQERQSTASRQHSGEMTLAPRETELDHSSSSTSSSRLPASNQHSAYTQHSREMTSPPREFELDQSSASSRQLPASNQQSVTTHHSAPTHDVDSPPSQSSRDVQGDGDDLELENDQNFEMGDDFQNHGQGLPDPGDYDDGKLCLHFFHLLFFQKT